MKKKQKHIYIPSLIIVRYIAAAKTITFYIGVFT